MWIMDSRVLLANTRHLKSENREKKNYRWCATTAMGFKGQRDFRHVDEICIANKQNPLSMSSNMAM
jgi:hypothetical protein